MEKKRGKEREPDRQGTEGMKGNKGAGGGKAGKGRRQEVGMGNPESKIL